MSSATPGNDQGEQPDDHVGARRYLDSGPIDGDALVYWAHTTLLPLYERPLRTGVCWCPKWWEHPEAVFRLECIRRAWLGAVTSAEPSAMSDWALYCADAHMDKLLSPTGPFADCGFSLRDGYPRNHSPCPLPLQEPDDLDHTRFPIRASTTGSDTTFGGRSPNNEAPHEGGRGQSTRRDRPVRGDSGGTLANGQQRGPHQQPGSGRR